MPTASPKTKKPSVLGSFFWYTGCVITLGYAPKYYRKILKWQVYDLSRENKDHEAYSKEFNSKKLGLDTSVRAKQQVGMRCKGEARPTNGMFW